MTYQQQIRNLTPDHNMTTAQAQAFLEAAHKAAAIAAEADEQIARMAEKISVDAEMMGRPRRKWNGVLSG